MPIYRLTGRSPFPPPSRADPTGLLAFGGDLSVERLLQAYQAGIFPWYEAGQPILWWSPDPRLILEPDALHISRSLRKVLRRKTFEVRFDTAFSQVIRACARVERKDQNGTWITPEMEAAYNRLHELGYAHCAETWRTGELVGGIYGLYLGACFFGESMFSRRTDASKVALVALVEFLKARDVAMIDCQVASEHLIRLGAKEIPRGEFLRRLREALRHPTSRGRWGNATGGPSWHR